MQRTKPLRRVSTKRARELREYSKLRKQFLTEHPFCEVCRDSGVTVLDHDIHHKNGRNGKRLNDTAYWLGVCRTHHEFLHNNPKLARDKGWLI